MDFSTFQEPFDHCKLLIWKGFFFEIFQDSTTSASILRPRILNQILKPIHFWRDQQKNICITKYTDMLVTHTASNVYPPQFSEQVIGASTVKCCGENRSLLNPISYVEVVRLCAIPIDIGLLLADWRHTLVKCLKECAVLSHIRSFSHIHKATVHFTHFYSVDSVRSFPKPAMWLL